MPRRPTARSLDQLARLLGGSEARLEAWLYAAQVAALEERPVVGETDVRRAIVRMETKANAGRPRPSGPRATHPGHDSLRWRRRPGAPERSWP